MTLQHRTMGAGFLAQLERASDMKSDDARARERLELEVHNLRRKLAAAEREIESLREAYDAKQVDAQPRLMLTLKVFAKQQHISYSTAYRAMQDGCVQGKAISKGKHTCWMVYPDTYTPRQKKVRRK